MNLPELEARLSAIADKRNALSGLDYNNEEYDRVEEELHDLEDDFQEEYGDYLEDVLRDIHDEYCPDSDVLLPIAYLAKEYLKSDEGYQVKPNQGVLVDVDDFPGKNVRLVLAPGPVRFILQIDPETSQIVWSPNGV